MQIHCFYRLSFVSPSFTIYEAEYPFVGAVIRKCVFVNLDNKDIIFCWVHSYTGIGGNVKADSAAKSALELPHTKVGVPYIDFKHCISQYILSSWQGDWNGAVANKLHSVKPVLGDWQSSYGRCTRIKLPCVVPASVIHI